MSTDFLEVNIGYNIRYFNARLVDKGFNKKEGIYFFNI